MICEDCGHRNELARRVTQPEKIPIVCHECERPIAADVTAEILMSNRAIRA